MQLNFLLAPNKCRISFTYTNYKGETSKRIVIPLGVEIGETVWHPEKQFLLRAFDVEKNAERQFAIKDIVAASIE